MNYVQQRLYTRSIRVRRRRPHYRKKRHFRIEGMHVSREFILKIHGWCNLACTYCYMYESKDQSWREKPRQMSPRIAAQVANRLGEYVREHNLGNLRIVLHGGEPLLAGMKFIRFIVESIRAAVPRGCRVTFRMQTNGTLFSEKVLLELAELGIKLGVSLDGTKQGNAQRILRSGRPSYDGTMRGIRLLAGDERWKHLFERVLCVVDLNNNPEETMEALFFSGALGADLLLPLQNHDNMGSPLLRFSSATPYADWLIRAFWKMQSLLSAHPESDFGVRFFDQIIQLTYYRAMGWEFPWNKGVEVIGPFVVGAIVIETDGTYELLDGRKTIRAGEAYTGLRVHHHRATKALRTMLEATEAQKISEPPKACLPCPLLDLCGGGYYLHRWSSANGYDNPSVYCADLIKIITFLIKNVTWIAVHLQPSPPPSAVAWMLKTA